MVEAAFAFFLATCGVAVLAFSIAGVIQIMKGLWGES